MNTIVSKISCVFNFINNFFVELFCYTSLHNFPNLMDKKIYFKLKCAKFINYLTAVALSETI